MTFVVTAGQRHEQSVLPRLLDPGGCRGGRTSRTRYDKLATHSLALLLIASILIWL